MLLLPYHTDITNGITGTSLTVSLGTPDQLALTGNAFPVVVTADNSQTRIAAVRLSATGGRVVAFNKEAYIQSCPSDATASICRMDFNALRWAAGIAPSGGATSFRLAITSTGILSTTGLSYIKAAAVSVVQSVVSLVV